MANSIKNPHIPMRDGVSASCICLPRMRQAPWVLLLDFLCDQLPNLSRQAWLQRMTKGAVLGENGECLPPQTVYQGGKRVYYWREWVQEDPIPFKAEVIFEDAHLLVVDKPHFLPVTPGGKYVRETVLVRLKQQYECADLSPLHRIDRETAGLVLFSRNPSERNAYQQLFRLRKVRKTYLAIAAPLAQQDLVPVGEPFIYRSCLQEDPNRFFRMIETQGPANSETQIRVLRHADPWWVYQLDPVTGKRHQLRAHMNALGSPIWGDQFYPEVLRAPHQNEDFLAPLQLLAQTLEFTDPITGAFRQFRSRRRLLLDSPGD